MMSEVLRLLMRPLCWLGLHKVAEVHQHCYKCLRCGRPLWMDYDGDWRSDDGCD